MAQRSYQLVMRSGPNPGKVFDLEPRELTIGRDITNDIVINDAEVSRKHARLIPQSGGFVLEDTGSTNGTFVNGQRLMGPHLLRPSELILFGENVSLAFEPIAFDPDATLATPASFDMPPSRQAAPPPPPVEVYPAPPVQAEPEPYRPEPYREEYQAPPPTPAPQYTPPPQYSAPSEYSAPPQYTPPPAYSSQAPPMEEFVEPERRSNRTWFLAGCGCLLILACVLLALFLFWVDSGGVERWCQFFTFLPGCP